MLQNEDNSTMNFSEQGLVQAQPGSVLDQLNLPEIYNLCKGNTSMMIDMIANRAFDLGFEHGVMQSVQSSN